MLVRIALAGLLVLSFAAAVAPTASASCRVTVGPWDGYLCSGPDDPNGQGSTCVSSTSNPLVDPNGPHHCVTVGSPGSGALACYRMNAFTGWTCV